MHPALSVILFTTTSGAGYGIVAWLGLAALFGMVPAEQLGPLVALGLGLALVAAGLLSSTAHLGRPERAWRALSQWRSSWLSREGVLALATFLPAVTFGAGLLGHDPNVWWVRLAALLSTVGALATVYATAMIYASLKPVPAWHGARTPVSYLAFSLMSGLTLLNVVAGSARVATAAALLTAAAWAWKRAVWRRLGTASSLPPASRALGLADGEVRSVEWPHTQANFVMKEMGFRVARKHAARLRIVAQALAFAAPVLLIGLSIVLPEGGKIGAAALAAVSQLAGLLVERWLFFAEAKHVVSLYYGV